MITKAMLKSAIAAAALTLAFAGQAGAETGFSTLAGIKAEPMNAAEMEATQGKLVPCVSEICGGAGGILSGSPFAGVDIAPLSTGFILGDVAAAYPWVWDPLFPGFPAGSGGLPGTDQWLGTTLGNVNATLGMVGLGF